MKATEHAVPTYTMEMAELPHQATAVVRGHVAASGIADFLSTAFSEVIRAAGAAGVAPTGPPYARYVVENGGFDIEAGFPVTRPVDATEPVEPSELPAGHVVRTLHVGDYGALGDAYRAVADWVIDNGYATTGKPWECYLDDLDVPEPRTMVYLPIAEPQVHDQI